MFPAKLNLGNSHGGGTTFEVQYSMRKLMKPLPIIVATPKIFPLNVVFFVSSNVVVVFLRYLVFFS